jgi:hypothetical protein
VRIAEKRGLRSGIRLLLCVCLLALAGAAWAQPSGTSTGSLYRAPVFKYYVWGQVRTPGAFSLGAEADIMELLSAAGGPTNDADVRHVVVFQALTQKRVKVDLTKMLNSGQIIRLSPGDVVMMPDSPWRTTRNAFGIVGTVVSFATLAVTIWIALGGVK